MASVNDTRSRDGENPAAAGVRAHAHNVLLLYFVGAYGWTWSLNLVKILAQRDRGTEPTPMCVT